MKSRDFVFWLQGVFEVGNPTSFNEHQVAVIKQHLQLVFVHDPDVKALEHVPVPPAAVAPSAQGFPNIYQQPLNGSTRPPGPALAYC